MTDTPRAVTPRTVTLHDGTFCTLLDPEPWSHVGLWRIQLTHGPVITLRDPCTSSIEPLTAADHRAIADILDPPLYPCSCPYPDGVRQPVSYCRAQHLEDSTDAR